MDISLTAERLSSPGISTLATQGHLNAGTSVVAGKEIDENVNDPVPQSFRFRV